MMTGLLSWETREKMSLTFPVSDAVGLYLQNTAWNSPFNTYSMGDQAGFSA